MREDYVCSECGHEYEELGDGKCYVCGGNIIPIEEVGQEEPEYPEDLMEEEGATPPEEFEDWQEPGTSYKPPQEEPEEV